MAAFLRVILHAREQTESDDDNSDDGPDGQSEPYQPKRKQRILRMRCYACAGTGRLEIMDLPSGSGRRQGRRVRCIACNGTGRVFVG